MKLKSTHTIPSLLCKKTDGSIRIKCIVALAVSGLLVVGCITAFRSLGSWLVIQSTPPQKLDAIFTFGGEAARNVYSEILHKQYPEATWIISTDTPKDALRKLVRHRADTTNLLFVDTCKNTKSEVVFCKQWLEKALQHKQSVTLGLVSGPYHMRRINILKSKQSFPPAAKIYYLPVPLSYYRAGETDYKNWWKNKALRGLVLLEVKKIVGSIFL